MNAEHLILSQNVCLADNKPFEFTALFHTYFRVPDVTRTAISGLKGLTYVDKVHVVVVTFSLLSVFSAQIMYGRGNGLTQGKVYQSFSKL